MWISELNEKCKGGNKNEKKSFGELLGALRLKLDKLLGFDQVEGYEKRKNKRKNK